MPNQKWIYTDSQLVARCATGEWQRSTNQKIWAEYDVAVEQHEVTLEWIRKDSHPHNQTAHKLANLAANMRHETA
jgi:ribonuclease HI